MATLLVLAAACNLVCGCGSRQAAAPMAEVAQTAAPVEKPLPTLAEEVAKYKAVKPKQWGGTGGRGPDPGAHHGKSYLFNF
jgi:hypothetical protein